MRPICRPVCKLLVVVLLIVLAASPAVAQTGAGYDLSWNTLDGGGGTSSGGGYSLSGTVGQPDAHPAAGAGYLLLGGFWHQAGSLTLPILFLPYVPH